MATTMTHLDEAEARQWIDKVERLNQEVDKTLKEVAELLKKINTISAGPFVDTLVRLGEAFHNQFEKLKSVCVDFIQKVKDAIDKLKQAAESLKDSVVSGVGHVINAIIT